MAHHNPSSTHRRNLAAPDPASSMDPIARNNPKFAASSSPSYNPTTHFSKMSISRRSTRARSPPPLGRDPHPVLASNLQGSKKSLSKSAIFEGSNVKQKPFSQSCPQGAQTTLRVVREIKGAGLEKVQDSPVVGVINKGERKDFLGRQKEKFPMKKEASGEGGGAMVKPIARLGRSKSLCDARLELVNFLVINGVKVFNTDMPPFMQIRAVGSARKTCDSLEKFSSKSLALSLKKEFDEAYGPAWHCIVGTSFGSFVTHSVGGFLYFSMDQKLHILLFKTTVQRAG